MKYRISLLVFLLAIALLIQNTCPHGYAGKSTVASACSHCPQKQVHKKVPEGTALSGVSQAPAHLPLFVLDIRTTRPVFRLAAVAIPQPVIRNPCKNTASDELLQPPRA